MSKSEHGQNGPIHISYPQSLERGLTATLDAVYEKGIQMNTDLNSGDTIGVGVVASTANNGIRSTAASYLLDPPKNLTVVGDSPVTKILIEDKRAVGVAADNKICKSVFSIRIA